MSARLSLRWYQQEAVDSAFRYLRERDGHPLVVAPTGSGKALMIAETCRRALTLDARTRIVVTAHVEELVAQNEAEFLGYAPELRHRVGVVHAGLRRREWDAQIVFAGVQSAYRHAKRLGVRHLIIPDEAHMIGRRDESMYGQLFEGVEQLMPGARRVGFTATPFRLDSGSLTHGENAPFTSVCYSVDIVKLIEEGYLCPLVSRTGAVAYDVSEVRSVGGDYAKGDLERTINAQAETTKAALVEALALTHDRKAGLVFCASVEQTGVVADFLSANGRSAVVVTGKTAKAERQATVERFRRGGIGALVNVGVFTTGFNARNVDHIIDLAPTQSPGRHIQKLGRLMRLHPGKEDGLVLCFSGNLDRHGPINLIKPPTRSPSKGDGDAPMKSCPQCFRDHIFAGMRLCPSCGHEFDINGMQTSTTASDAVIIDVEAAKPKLLDVDFVEYRRHKKDGKPDSMRVDYFAELKCVASEWVCPQHFGRARENAERWLDRRAPSVPSTTDEALALADAGALLEPSKIRVERDGKFTRVTGYVFDDDAEAKRDARMIAIADKNKGDTNKEVARQALDGYDDDGIYEMEDDELPF